MMCLMTVKTFHVVMSTLGKLFLRTLAPVTWSTVPLKSKLPVALHFLRDSHSARLSGSEYDNEGEPCDLDIV